MKVVDEALFSLFYQSRGHRRHSPEVNISIDIWVEYGVVLVFMEAPLLCSLLPAISTVAVFFQDSFEKYKNFSILFVQTFPFLSVVKDVRHESHRTHGMSYAP